MWVWYLDWEAPLEKGIATHSNILAWRIPWTKEPGGLPSIGSQSQTQLKWLGNYVHAWISGLIWVTGDTSVLWLSHNQISFEEPSLMAKTSWNHSTPGKEETVDFIWPGPDFPSVQAENFKKHNNVYQSPINYMKSQDCMWNSTSSLGASDSPWGHAEVMPEEGFPHQDTSYLFKLWVEYWVVDGWKES